MIDRADVCNKNIIDSLALRQASRQRSTKQKLPKGLPFSTHRSQNTKNNDQLCQYQCQIWMKFCRNTRRFQLKRNRNDRAESQFLKNITNLNLQKWH